MKKTQKKILKFFGIGLVILLGLLIALPLILQGKITKLIKSKVNENINATLDFDEASLSLLKNFPNAYVGLTNTSLVNKAPFEGDTLFSSGTVALKMSIGELFKGEEDPISIKSLTIDNAKIHVKVDKAENANYDITIDSGEIEETSEEEESSNFKLALESYEITNTDIIYDDFASGMHLVISDMNHFGTGDLSLEKSKLKTQTDALVSFELDSTKYLNKNKLSLDAIIGIDLAQSKYSFLENKVLVNQLALVLDGFVQINETNQEVDISFKTPSSDFKNFLAVIPEAYSKNIEDVTTTGNFELAGQFKGVVDENHIPAFNIKIKSDNASFKYPDLPKTVKNVFIDTEINNETGITEDTYVDINKLSFQIDEDRFNLNAKIRDLLGNTKVNAHMDGKMNLANISEAYPVPEDFNLSGLLSANVTTAFDMASLENKQYKNTKTSGELNVSNFEYNSEELNNPVAINAAEVTFNPETVSLNSFDGKTGQTDFKATGTINNLLGFVFNDENVEGKFNLQSNTFAMNDFMVEETNAGTETETPSNQTSETAEGTTEERIKIPSFLDATIDAAATTVIYDDITLKNVSGQLLIKDETAIIKNLSSDLFGGKLKMNGEVSTKNDVSTFDMALGMDSFQIAESFKSLDLFKALAPLASALQGKLNSDIKISGNLKEDMTPNLASLSGSLVGQLLSTKINPNNAPVLNTLGSNLSFIDLNSLDLKNLKTAMSFENGSVKVKPFSLKYKDIDIEIDGNHTFDQNMQYKAVLDVPAKYLGSEVTALMNNIDDSSTDDITIPVTANIGGNYKNPSVSTDLTSGISSLTTQLVEIQKQKLLGQGKDKAQDLLGGLLGSKTKDDDSTETKTSASTVLGSLLGSNKKDSVETTNETSKKDGVKEAASSVLGGLFGKKKKKDTVN